MQRLGVITNPHSKKNRNRRDRKEALQRIVGDCGLVVETQSVDEIAPALSEFKRHGADCWISDGGDGAFHWMLNTALDNNVDDIPLLLPANGGTIDFVAKKAGIKGNCEQILTELSGVCRGDTGFPIVEVDSLIAEGVTTDGQPFRRIGFGCAAAGVGQNFFDKYYEHEQPGAVSIMRVTARAIGSLALLKSGLGRKSRGWGTYAEEVFRPARARVTIDGQLVDTELHGAINAGAIDVKLGGVFHAFPLARERGVLHFQAGRIAPLEMIRNIPRFHQGKSIESPTLVECAGHRMDIEAIDKPLSPVLDGEQYHDIQRLTLRVGPQFPIPSVFPR